MHTCGTLQKAHIIGIQITVFIGCSEIKRLYGIPCDGIGLGLHDELTHRRSTT